MELYYSLGPKVINDLKGLGFKIFLDLKIHDIPNTAKKSAKAITKLGVDMINVHASGGIEMMKAAKSGMLEALSEDTLLKKPIIIAVTQLTSTDQKILENELGINKRIYEVVVHYAQNAKEAGLDGVVSSSLEVKLIKEKIGKDFLCITPGIRLPISVTDDQKRITTPEQAFNNGSDYIVIGRAVTTAKNPSQQLKQILNELEE
jgi:orotidine-5'-phosphate decarboxylase